jgi:hypothetical protein
MSLTKPQRKEKKGSRTPGKMDNVSRGTRRKHMTLGNAKADGRIKLKYSYTINKMGVLGWTLLKTSEQKSLASRC